MTVPILEIAGYLNVTRFDGAHILDREGCLLFAVPEPTPRYERRYGFLAWDEEAEQVWRAAVIRAAKAWGHAYAVQIDPDLDITHEEVINTDA